MCIDFDYSSLGFKAETSPIVSADMGATMRIAYRSNTGNDDYFFIHEYNKNKDVNTIMIFHSKNHMGNIVIVESEKDIISELAREKHQPSISKLRRYFIDDILTNLTGS